MRSLRKASVGRSGIPGGFLALLLFPVTLQAQSIPPDRTALENGEGAGMARYADVNGYPGPHHVLEMREQLGLSEEQVKDIETIVDEMTERSRRKGAAIIAAEEQLAELFENGRPSRTDIEWLAGLIGTLRGELRTIHLNAHLQATEVLSKAQCDSYGRLRHDRHAVGADHQEKK